MKKIGFCVLGIVMFLITGCYEVNEDITISDKGTGTILTKMDMSGLIQMMQTMASEEELSKNGMDKAIDTTISFRSVMDTAHDVSAEQKRLYKDGNMKLQMNIKENLFKADVSLPFHSLADLQALMSGASTSGLASVFKKMFSGTDSSQPAAPVQDQGLEQINNVFDITVTKNSIVKKLNPEKYKTLMARPEMEQLKQMTSSGVEVLYTVNIHLPRPVKKADNDLVKLSADKKTASIKYDLMKLLDTPEKFSYSITY